MNTDLGLLIGRILVVPLFLLAGINKLGTIPPGTTAALERAGLPLPAVLATAGVAIEVIAPILIFIGLFTRWASLSLVVFTVLATYVAHRWWLYPEAAQTLQMGIFMKNLAITGLLALLALTGSGRIAIKPD